MITCYVALQLGYPTCFATIAFIKFYFGFPVLWLLYYTCSCPAFYLYSNPPVSCSYLIILWDFPAWHQLWYIYLLLYACAYGTVFMFMIQIYRYTCAYLGSPPGFRITTRRGVLTPLDPHVQVLELGACELPAADQSGAAVAWISSRPFRALSFQAPLCASRVFL